MRIRNNFLFGQFSRSEQINRHKSYVDHAISNEKQNNQKT